MTKVDIYISRREGIIEPTSEAILGSLHRQGFNNIKKLRVNKLITIEVENSDNIDDLVKQICEDLLVNNVMEDYSYEIKEI